MSRLSRVLLAVLLAALVLAGCQRNVKRATPESPQPHKDQLHQLLLERQRLLEGITENAQRYVDAGRMTAPEYGVLKKTALLAKLDLCQTRAERVEIREEVVRLDREAEAWIQRRAANGRVGEGERNQARVTRIESEIDLLKEQLNKGDARDER